MLAGKPLMMSWTMTTVQQGSLKDPGSKLWQVDATLALGDCPFFAGR